LAFATFLIWLLRIGACGVGACGFGAYDSYPESSEGSLLTLTSKKKVKDEKLKLPWSENP